MARRTFLHIRKFNVQTGEVRLEGIINSLVYTEKKKSKVRLWDKTGERRNLGNRAI